MSFTSPTSRKHSTDDGLCVIWNPMTCESWVSLPDLFPSCHMISFSFHNSLSGRIYLSFSFMLPVKCIDSNTYACWRLPNLSLKFQVLLGYLFHSLRWKKMILSTVTVFSKQKHREGSKDFKKEQTWSIVRWEVQNKESAGSKASQTTAGFRVKRKYFRCWLQQ